MSALKIDYHEFNSFLRYAIRNSLRRQGWSEEEIQEFLEEY